MTRPTTAAPTTCGVPLRYAAVAASVGAAAIHFAVVSDHWNEWKLAGLFFGVLAWVQVGWAFAILQTRSRLVLALGALGQLGVVALWAVTREWGLPFGPSAGQPEAAGTIDIICCGLEVVAALAAGGLLIRRLADAPLRPPIAFGAAGLLVVAMAGVSVASLIPTVGGRHEHVHAETVAADGTAVTGHTHGGPAVTGAIPAGWTAGCHHGTMAGHAGGSCTDAPVTPAQRAAAEQLVAVTTKAATSRYPTLAAAEKAGYRVINQTGPLIHVGNPAYQVDGRVLDPNRIESLVYVSFGGQSLLLGAMYIAEPTAPNGPLIGGALTSWHIHTDLCVSATQQTAMNPRPDGSCPPGSKVGPTLQMLHVWTLPYDGGPFAEIDPAALTKAVTNELARRAAAAPKKS